MPRFTASPDDRWFWDNEPCRAGCPVHTDAGAYVVAIAEGRLAEGYTIARRQNPFASICGRVCAAPCERACRRGMLDAPVSIRALKRYLTERFGVESFDGAARWHAAHGPLAEPSGLSVGIVGGGPAGLSAAHDLRAAGHAVTVYEAHDHLGGMMVYGIPQYRLPRELIERECDAVVDMGVEVRTGCTIGVDVTPAELLDRHAAVFLAAGASRGRSLALPGSDLDGVMVAIEYLLNVNQGYRVTLGQRVVVVGGGNVAFDAARTALRGALDDEAADRRLALTTSLDVARTARRAGVQSVTVVALEDPTEIPADAEEIADAEREGITIVYRRAPNSFVGGNGRVTGLETLDVASVFDDQHRFNPVTIPGTEAVIEADTVILAIGQAIDLPGFEALELRRAPNGTVVVDPATLRTSHPKVWAGGDVAKGPRNLIDAIADGQRAAASIAAVLAGAADGAAPPGVRVVLTPREGFRRLATGYDSIERQHVPSVATARRTGFDQVELGYDDDGARLEALRCLRCFDNVILDPALCILCGLCVDVCPTDCITIGRADRFGAGTAEQSVLLMDEDRCIRCGLCVNRCPPGALTMEHAVVVHP